MAYIGKQPLVGNFIKLDAITASATDTYNLLNDSVAYTPQSASSKETRVYATSIGWR